MKDAGLRRIVKRVTLWRFVVDVAIARAIERVRGRERFVLGGACAKCAACCEAPSIRVGWLTWHLPTLRRAFTWWQRVVNGFALTATDFRARVLTFRCTHFDPATRLCDSYDTRPGMCRDYPRVLLYQPHPEMLPSCGYRPVRKDRKRMLRVIADQPMSDAQREKLRRELYLDE